MRLPFCQWIRTFKPLVFIHFLSATQQFKGAINGRVYSQILIPTQRVCGLFSRSWPVPSESAHPPRPNPSAAPSEPWWRSGQPAAPSPASPRSRPLSGFPGPSPRPIASSLLGKERRGGQPQRAVLRSARCPSDPPTPAAVAMGTRTPLAPTWLPRAQPGPQ